MQDHSTSQGSKPDLSLHSSTLPGWGVLDVIDVALAAGCGSLCAYTNAPQDGVTMPGAPPKVFPLITREILAEVKARLRASSMTITNLEFFPIWPETDLAQFASGLELGAEVGGKIAVVHLHDPDAVRAAERLAQFAEMAGQFELGVGLEFIGMAGGCRTFCDAISLVERVNSPNCGIAVDALHFFRTGGRLEALADLPRNRIAYVQLCDSKGVETSFDYFSDARNRLAPGAGDFPLVDFLRAAAGRPIDVEVPNTAIGLDRSRLAAHAVKAVDAARALVDQAFASAAGR